MVPSAKRGPSCPRIKEDNHMKLEIKRKGKEAMFSL